MATTLNCPPIRYKKASPKATREHREMEAAKKQAPCLDDVQERTGWQNTANMTTCVQGGQLEGKVHIPHHQLLSFRLLKLPFQCSFRRLDPPTSSVRFTLRYHLFSSISLHCTTLVKSPAFENNVLPSGNLDNFVHPTLPVSLGRDTKSRWSLLSGVYARRSKISHMG